MPAACLLFVWAGLIGLGASRMQTGWGLVLAISGSSSFTLGLLLAYWTSVDWMNLRLIRGQLVDGNRVLRDGEIAAIEGTVRVDGEPMVSPFSGTRSAAYTYVLSRQLQSHVRERSTRQLIAQGFHMAPTRIEGRSGSYRLGALPGFEDGLHESVQGDRWVEQARALAARLHGSAPKATDMECESRLLEARRGPVEEVHRDYCSSLVEDAGAGLVVEEQVLPVGEVVCVIGTFDDGLKGLTAGRRRIGPDLMVYKGAAAEVVSRVGKETAWFVGAAFVLVGLGALLLGIPILMDGA